MTFVHADDTFVLDFMTFVLPVFKCGVCGKEGHNKRYMQDHERACNKENPDELIPCEYCHQEKVSMRNKQRYCYFQ